MKKYRLIVIFIFICLLSGGSSKDSKLLKEYQRIAQETKAIRQISIEEAGLKAWSAQEDKDGYLWFAGDGNIRRFNGNSFQEMFAHYPAAERDSLKGIVSLDDKTLLVYGAHNVYAWDGVNFSRHVFDEVERIANVHRIHNSALFIGDRGYRYAFYADGELSRFETKTSLKDKETTSYYDLGSGTMLSQHGLLDVTGNNDALYVLGLSMSTSIRINKEKVNHDREAVFVYHYSKTGEDSLRVYDQDMLSFLSAEEIYELPTLHTDARGRSWVYINESPFFFGLDPMEDSLKKIELDDDIMILSVDSVGSNQDIVFYRKQDKYYLCDLQDLLDGKADSPEINFGSHNPRTSNIYVYLDGRGHVINSGNRIGFTSGRHNYIVLGQSPRGDGFEVWKVSDILTREIGGKGYSGQRNFRLFGSELLVLYYPSEAVTGVQVVEIYDRDGVLLKKTEIADASASWSYVAYNKHNDTLFLGSDKSYYMIPLTKNVERQGFIPKKVLGSDDSYNQRFTASKTKPLLLGTHWLSRDDKRIKNYSLFELHKDQTKELYSLEDADLIHQEDEQGLLYFKKHDRRTAKSEIVQYDLNSNRHKLLCEVEEQEKVLFLKDEFYLISHNTYRRYKNEELHASEPYSGFEQAFGEMAEPYEGGIASLWNLMQVRAIDDRGNLFFAKQSIGIDGTGMSLKGISRFYMYQSDKVEKPYLKEGAEPELRFPSFILNIHNNTVKYQPAWQWISIESGEVYVQHLEEQSGKLWLRISRSINGVLELNQDDASFEVERNYGYLARMMLSPAYRVAYRIGKLHYFHNQRGVSIDLDKYKAMGDYLNVYGIREHNGKLWVNIGTSLLKHDPKLNLTFQYGEKDGLPGKIEDFWIDPQGLVYILGKDALFTMQQAGAGIRINIPWFITGSTRHSSAQPLKLSYKQNSIIIPFELQSVIDPGKCMLEYRMKGIDKDWQRSPYQETIEYQRLRPGRYEFEIKAFSQDGEESETKLFKIRILPPWYAAWWAYLLYIMIALASIKLFLDSRVRKLKQGRERLEGLVEAGTREIREQHLKLSESIEYASLIQRSVLPPKEEMSKAFRDYFVIWHPRDVVGGDFYWLYRVPESGEVLFAIIDCTGHGVPGALLSMTVNTLLNNIVKERGERRLSEILSCLHREIAGTLHQKNANSQQDGLAISIVKYWQGDSILSFAGADQNLFYYNSGDRTVQQVRGSKFSLGGAKWHEELSFDEHRIEYTAGTAFYLFSDGIVDQPHPAYGRKLGSARWLELLSENATMPIAEQEQSINNLLQQMLEYSDQRDDITIIGLELP
jgi:serine phosphatase RsbU (regulator of sigma subunit)